MIHEQALQQQARVKGLLDVGQKQKQLLEKVSSRFNILFHYFEATTHFCHDSLGSAVVLTSMPITIRTGENRPYCEISD